ncbi:uncharacterized protein LOC107472924 [Arachis duranensis]|uniref:Uncharacterized protein LOC107472924 n=1 Tax=Arachis duranensis TaxID=130453 RepID=A0A6P4C8Q8_ARADU|nr:uncharacterized protein LOC107472924 [Arachis duranensis]
MEMVVSIISSSISSSFRYLVSLPPGDDGGEWLKEMRGNLGLMATVIATMAFQNGLNPPGGVIQNGDNGSVTCPLPIAHGQACPGQSVYAAVDRHGYSGFMLTNSISFLFSITTCILVISGVPLGPGYPTLVLAMLMSFSLILLAVSYTLGAFLLNPRIQKTHAGFRVFIYVFVTFLVVLLSLRFVALILAVRRVKKKADTTPALPSQ